MGVRPSAAADRLQTGEDSVLPIEPVALAELRVSSGLKMPDVLVLACARAHDATIATFDQRLSQHAG